MNDTTTTGVMPTAQDATTEAVTVTADENSVDTAKGLDQVQVPPVVDDKPKTSPRKTQKPETAKKKPKKSKLPSGLVLQNN